eukprot:752163-Hanusia_phi.AAC.2
MQEQDESLDDLSLAVTRIGHMGLTIHNELKEQESLIDDLHERTDFSVNNMSDVNKLDRNSSRDTSWNSLIELRMRRDHSAFGWLIVYLHSRNTGIAV